MNWWILMIIILFLIILMASPISALVAVGNEEPRIKADVRWLWGFLRFRLSKGEASIRVLGWQIFNKRPGEHPQKAAGSKPVSTESGDRSHRFARFLNKPFMNALFETLGKLRAAVSVNAWADMQLGFPDPARTGIVYGMLGSLCSMGTFPGLEVSPDFVSQKSSGLLTVRFDTATGKLLWVAVRFVLARPVRSIWWPELNWEGVKQ